MNVYVNQFNTHTDINLLPLAAGLLSANARSDALVKRTFELHVTVRRDAPAAVARGFVAPAVLAYCCYMWNIQHSLRVAGEAKLLHRNAINVFGGPSIPRDARKVREFMLANPQVDIAAMGEGELTFRELLHAIAAGSDLREVPGIAFRGPGGLADVCVTALRPRIGDLDALDSPFLDGTFDALLRTDRKYVTGALWETNRGCPFSCTFCDWGQATQSRVHEFSRERLVRELRWMAANEFEFCWAADANFGIRPRDVEIAHDIAAIHAETGFPRFFQVSWTKNSSRRVIDMADILAQSGIRSPITLSAQSFDARTLEAVKRRNIKLSAFAELKRHFSDRGIQTYTEMILGLPEETYESFCDGLVSALSPAFGDFVVMYLCRLLENTEMSSEPARRRHGLQTRLCRLEIPRRTGVHESVTEFEEVVVGSTSMPVASWERAFDFGYFLCAVYNQRLAHVVITFLRLVLRVAIRPLVESWIASADAVETPVLHSALCALREHRHAILRGEPAVRSLQGFGDYMWEPQETCYLIAARSPARFLTELRLLCVKYLRAAGVVFDAAMLAEAFDFQSALVPEFGAPQDAMRRYRWNWDLWYSNCEQGPPDTTGDDAVLVRFESPPMKESSVEEFLSQQIRVTRSGSRTTCRVVSETSPVQ